VARPGTVCQQVELFENESRDVSGGRTGLPALRTPVFEIVVTARGGDRAPELGENHIEWEHILSF
jgi:hypothetical protein